MASIFKTPLTEVHYAALAKVAQSIAELGDGYVFNEFPIKCISVESVLSQADSHTMQHYVWPDEGESDGTRWVFHKGENKPTEPLLIDATSAHAFNTIYGAINDDNRAKLRHALLHSRWLCVWAFDNLIWPNVKFGG